MKVKLEDVCEKGTSNLKLSDVVDKNGDYPIYGASGYIGNVDFYKQESPYVAVVKDGAGIGRAILCPAKSSVIGTMQYLIPKSNILPEYLYYVVSSLHLEKYFSGATIPHIYFRDYKDETFNLHPLTQQYKIVNILNHVENMIQFRNKELQLLNELIKSRFVEMFESVAKFVPLNYYISSLIAGKSLAGDVPCINKVLKTGAVSFDKFDMNQVKYLPLTYQPDDKHKIHQGDVIISRMNTAELVGATGYVDIEPKNIFLPDRLWKADITPNCNPIFLWQMLISLSVKNNIRKIATGTSGSMKNISKKDFLAIPVLKVPLSLQNQFAAFVQQVDKSRLAVQKSLDELEILKKSLMQEYFG